MGVAGTASAQSRLIPPTAFANRSRAAASSVIAASSSASGRRPASSRAFAVNSLHAGEGAADFDVDAVVAGLAASYDLVGDHSAMRLYDIPTTSSGPSWPTMTATCSESFWATAAAWVFGVGATAPVDAASCSRRGGSSTAPFSSAAADAQGLIT